MSPDAVYGLIATTIFGLIGALYAIHVNTTKSQWTAIDRKADEQDFKEAVHARDRALTQLKLEHDARMHELKNEFNARLAELATRQDREVDALKAEMLRVSSGLIELRRDVNAGHLVIMERLQEITLLVRRAPA